MSQLLTADFLPLEARTTSGSAELPLPNDHNNIAVVINVTTRSGTSPTCVFSLDDSEDGVTWYRVKTNSSINNVGTYRIFIGPTDGPALGRLRLNWTLGGTTPSFTFAARVLTRARMGR